MNTTCTQFQVVQQAISQLWEPLRGLQWNASQPSSVFYYDPAARSCHDTLQTTVAAFRGNIAFQAYETADFLLGNVLSNLLQQTTSIDAKKLVIDRFLYAPDPDRPSLIGNKMRIVRNLQQSVEELQVALDITQQSIQHLGLNPAIIHHNLDIILGGTRTLYGFYEQICQSLDNFRVDLDIGNVSVQDVQREAKWLAVMSADLKAFASHA
ncbi:hypothetical protein QCA50_013555 [Cerrena zonata]|uniref:HEPN AbiU2-like domain-containing protein n=1 Tax=Cerrena zonata TaxID=2478898 RepID=A0AAW0FQF5_9APHY